MAILGITNRAENWKTATHFAPLFGHGSVRLARRLVGADSTFEPGQVRLELFWRGVRDYIHQHGGSSGSDWANDFADRYRTLFPELRGAVEAYARDGKFRVPTSDNYCAATPGQISRLASNLRNTEIDIVLESPEHLFIGEAKHETSFHASSGDVLTHQLIRQYVTAHILLSLLGQKKEVVPFVVGDSTTAMLNSEQVRFMIERGYMSHGNVLEWGDIEALR